MMVVMVWEPGLEVPVLVPIQLIAGEFSCCLRAPDGVNDDLLQVLQPLDAILNAVRALLGTGNVQAKSRISSMLFGSALSQVSA